MVGRPTSRSNDATNYVARLLSRPGVGCVPLIRSHTHTETVCGQDYSKHTSVQETRVNRLARTSIWSCRVMSYELSHLIAHERRCSSQFALSQFAPDLTVEIDLPTEAHDSSFTPLWHF